MTTPLAWHAALVAPRAATAAAGARPALRRKRGPDRRAELLEIAIQLFYERGYQITAMEDIGHAAGITGSGIYRHFRNKNEILTAALEEGTAQILGRVNEIVETSATAEETLLRLIDNFVRAVLNRPALAALVLNERRLFPPEARVQFDHAHRLHVEEWARALREVLPDADAAEIQLRVVATMGLLGAVTNFPRTLEREPLGVLLRASATAALMGDARPTPAP
jgi:AcrR family transcriptional regulator